MEDNLNVFLEPNKLLKTESDDCDSVWYKIWKANRNLVDDDGIKDGVRLWQWLRCFNQR